jgi:hypothetical protein
MTLCGKCGERCDPRSISQTYISTRRGVCHRICPRRAKRAKSRTYLLGKPQKRGWQAARKAALTYTCEVSNGLLFKDHACGVPDYIGVVDHIVPERFLLSIKKNPHARENLICISPEVHGRKRAAEDQFLKSGDVLTFWNILEQQGWPMDRVYRAMQYAGLRSPGELNAARNP